MASAVTIKCFGSPHKCYNCIRKNNYLFQEGKKESELRKYVVQEVNRKVEDEKIKIEPDSISKCEDSNEKEKIGVEKMCKGDVTDIKEIGEEVESEIKSEYDDSKGKSDKGEKEKNGEVDKIMEKLTLKVDMDNKNEEFNNEKKVAFETKMNIKEEEINKEGNKGEKEKSKDNGSEAKRNNKKKMNEKECGDSLETENEQFNKEKKDNESKMGCEETKEKDENKEVYKRCTGCFLMTYCDRSCQEEHWEHVHRYHCSYLSGKKKMKEDSCDEWAKYNKPGNDREIYDINSPKIGCAPCFTMGESRLIRLKLGRLFGLHGYQHGCNCPIKHDIEHPYPLPFPMGKISDKLLCTGLDELLSHATILCKTIVTKTMNARVKEQETIDLLSNLGEQIRHSRMFMWRSILILGTSIFTAPFQGINDAKNKLDDIMGTENPWWAAMSYTLDLVLSMSSSQEWDYNLDASSFKDPGFVRFLEDQKNHIRNIAFVSENNLWHRFKLWPTLENQSLVLRLPKDVHCESCNKDYAGQSLGANAPLFLIPRVTNNGNITVCCCKKVNESCAEDYLQKHSIADDHTDEVKREMEDFRKKARYCQLCLRKSKGSHRCANCHSVQYCSVECSKKDFKFHTSVCNAWAKDPTKKIMSKKEQRKWSKPGPL